MLIGKFHLIRLVKWTFYLLALLYFSVVFTRTLPYATRLDAFGGRATRRRSRRRCARDVAHLASVPISS